MLEQVDDHIRNSEYELSLELIENGNRDHKIQIRKAKVLLQLGYYSRLNFTPKTTLKEYFEEAHQILDQISYENDQISLYKNLLLLKYYHYPYNKEIREQLFEQLNGIEKYPRLKIILLREKANTLINDDPLEKMHEILDLYKESIDLAFQLEEWDELSESLLELSSIIRSFFVIRCISNSESDQWYKVIKELLPKSNVVVQAFCLTTFAWNHFRLGKSIDRYPVCKTLFRQLEQYFKKYELPDSLQFSYYTGLGHFETAEGNYREALPYHMKVSDMDGLPLETKAHNSIYIARCYYLLGDLENTFKYAELAAKDKHTGGYPWVSTIYFLYALELEDEKLINDTYNKAMEVFEHFPYEVFGKELQENATFKLLCMGLMQKRSSRLKSKMQALQYFEEIVEFSHTFPDFYIMALLNLIDLLILELKSSGDVILFNEIDQYMEIYNNYLNITQDLKMKLDYYILQARIKFVKMQYVGSFKTLNQAKQFAEQNGMNRYQKIIEEEIAVLEYEHQKIRLMNVDKTDVKTLAENMKMDDLIDQILKNRKSTEKKLLKEYMKIAMKSVQE